jgi:N-acetyl-gamma-glutamyl-phosphate reductase
VAGALGAVGSLVADLLAHHPHVELAALTARDTEDESSPIGKALRDVYPEHRVDLPLRTIDEIDFEDFSAAVVAYPAGPAAHLVAELRAAGLIVVDSCGDFRFNELDTYEEWYGLQHGAPALIGEAVYGLPELNRADISGAGLVGNPGCYPTASVLALAPLVQSGLLLDVVVDAKSGVSGAGKRGGEAPDFVGTHDSMHPYGAPGHRHQPEIEEQLGLLGYAGNLSFVPHLIPIDQGELVSCYATPARDITPDELRDLYDDAYGREPFVEVAAELPRTRDVQRTNICRIHPVLDGDRSRIFVFATIDNLWKGGASQAIQNLNLALGLPEQAGIPGGASGSSLDRVPVSA